MIVLPDSISPEDQERFNSVIADLLGRDFDEADPEDDGLERLYEDRCPTWPLLQHRQRCSQAVHELYLMSQDGYLHELGSIHEYILGRSLDEWDLIADLEPQEIDALQRMSSLLSPSDVPLVHLVTHEVLTTQTTENALSDRIPDLLELMPDDIRVRVEAVLAKERSTPPDKT